MSLVQKSEDHKSYGKSSWQEHKCQTHLMANQPIYLDLLIYAGKREKVKWSPKSAGLLSLTGSGQFVRFKWFFC